MVERDPNEGSHIGTGRVEAFSDGVLAVAITLLVLEVKVPATAPGDEAALWTALWDTLPAIVVWAVSFLFILVFWVAHHTLFAQLARADRGLFWLNGVFLLAICFTPFPTALSVQHPWSVPAAFLLSLAMLLTASSFSLLRWYACFYAGLARPETEATLRTAMRRSLAAPCLYALACMLAFVWTPLALTIQVLVAMLYILPGHTNRPPSRYGRKAPQRKACGKCMCNIRRITLA